MSGVADVALQIAYQSWVVLVEAAPWLIVGFAAAGLVHAFVSAETIGRRLGGPGFGPVVRAALIGVPLPLCSCGVLPAAMGLRKQGASKGATVSFLISTPETGVDSIAVTYALMDPLMTVWRPLSALVTAVVAGVIETLTGEKSTQAAQPEKGAGIAAPVAPVTGTVGERLGKGLKYGFVELLWEIAPWLAVGIVAAGAITALVPQGWLEFGLGGGFAAMLVMLAAGVPMYICATASTPVAAALILKGLSPGAALVFLLVGPATNVATLVAVGKSLGVGASLRYLASISISALAMGFALDWVYAALEMDVTISTFAEHAEHGELVGVVSAVALVLAVIYAMVKARRRPGFT